jgi:hypothetical protein
MTIMADEMRRAALAEITHPRGRLTTDHVHDPDRSSDFP